MFLPVGIRKSLKIILKIFKQLKSCNELGKYLPKIANNSSNTHIRVKIQNIQMYYLQTCNTESQFQVRITNHNSYTVTWDHTLCLRLITKTPYV